MQVITQEMLLFETLDRWCGHSESKPESLIFIIVHTIAKVILRGQLKNIKKYKKISLGFHKFIAILPQHVVFPLDPHNFSRCCSFRCIEVEWHFANLIPPDAR